MKTSPLSYIEISKKNLVHNIQQFRGLAKKGTKIMAMIKANAYGHGQNEVAKILEAQADYFGVNSVEELALLRRVSKKKTFVLGYVQGADIKKVISLGCVLSIFSKEQLLKVSAITKSFNKVQEVHMAIDAHLGREGILIEELAEFFTTLQKCKNIKMTGLYAHFANIEDTHNFTHAEKQISAYKNAVALAEKYGFKISSDGRVSVQTHISATSGLFIYEKGLGVNHIVRIGIGLYGLWPSEYIQYLYKNKIILKPVITWKTSIAQVKNLPAGETIGYGLTYLTKRKTKIAVVPQGYSDGLDRLLSNKGEVLIGGKRCSILGRIAMNMFVVDVSQLKNVKAEDEVVLLGRQGKAEITAEEIALQAGTINYEVMARLSALLPRVVI